MDDSKYFDTVLKGKIEEILNKFCLYEKKDLVLVDGTIRKLENMLGNGYIVGYRPSDDNSIVFMFAKVSFTNIRVWTVALGPSSFSWNEH